METQYSSLTDEEINHMQNEHASQYKEMLDDSLPFEDRKLDKLVAAKYKDKPHQKRVIKSVCDCFLEYLYRHLRELSIIIYLAMLKLNEFGPHGENMVSISFCRCILNIPNDCQATFIDAMNFELILDEYDRRNGSKSGEEYKSYCNNFSINLFGRNCTAADFDDIANELFILMGMEDIFLWGALSSPYGLRVCLGVLEEHEIEKNKYLVMRKELIRSPQLISSIAAEVFKDSTIIRMVSIEIIFRNKWEEYFNQSALDRKIALYHDYSAIREGFKKYALLHYGISNKEELEQKREAFINDMILIGVIWHELGHHIGNEDMKQEHYDFHWVFPNADSIGSSLEEALADYAGQKGSKKGPIISFLEMARTNINAATAMVFVYLSDYWFLDDEDEYFGIRSNVMVGTMISFLRPDGTVDFERLGTSIEKLYIFFLERFGNLVDQLLTVIRNAEYDFGVRKLDFQKLEERIFEMHQNTRNAKPLEELRHSSVYWANAVDFLEKYSVEGWKRYQQVLADETINVQRALLNIITENNGEKYNNSLRLFIVEKAKESGIIQKLPKVEKPVMSRQVSQMRQLLRKPYTTIDQGNLKIKTRRKAK
jgi:flagellar biosynthesis regulator FlbT